MTTESGSGQMVRALDWKGAFWVAAGVPPLVLFSIGGIAGTTGKLAFLVWIISMIMGFLQSFTYAEMAGMFGNKSGGTSVYGATAWLRYSKLIAPLSVWCNWFAWSPVLSLGCAIAAGYILNALFPIPLAESQQVIDWVTANIASYTAETQSVVDYMAANAGVVVEDAIKAVAAADGVSALTPAFRVFEAFTISIPGLGTLHFNSTFIIGVALMLVILMIQHRGIASTANAQKWLAIIVLVPLLLVGLVPIFTGAINTMNVTNLLPPTAAYSGVDGEWNVGGWTLFLGGLYIAAWSTYGFETAVCYTRELKDPKRDTFRAIFYSGLLCCVFFFIIPFAFQGVLGQEGMLAAGIVDGTGVGEALGNMVGGGPVITQIIAHTLSGVARWLVAKVSQHCERKRRAIQSDVDRLCVQRLLAGAGLGRGGLFLCAGDFKRRLHSVQLPEPECGLDPPNRLGPYGTPLEGAQLADRGQHRACLCKRAISWRRGESLGL
jgi:amino acid transporter